MIARTEEARPYSVDQATGKGEDEKQREAEALQRQLLQAEKHRAFIEYDLVPDIFRLRVSVLSIEFNKLACPHAVASIGKACSLSKAGEKEGTDPTEAPWLVFEARACCVSKTRLYIWAVHKSVLPV